jgi:hypothetical protein
VASALLRSELGASDDEVAAVEADVADEIARIELAALTASFPGPLTIPEFCDG